MKINYLDIFRVAEDGIYFLDGKFCFSDIIPKEDFYGELKRGDGKFTVEFYVKNEFAVEFNFYSFSEGQTRTSLCLGKAKSFCLFLENHGIVIKDLV